MAGNYVSETNFHNKYSIEELKSLFRNSSSITVENLYQIINQCFNYELVSGDGIKIVELKSNSDTRNTTRTYKISCTCKGSGSGSGGGGGKEYFVMDGVRWADDSAKDTMMADMYDGYQTEKTKDDPNVYPVKLSKTGQLIVDLSTLSITANIKANPTLRENLKDGLLLKNGFTLTCNVTGGVIHKIVLEGDFYNSTSKIKLYNEEISLSAASYTKQVDICGCADENGLTIDSIRRLSATIYYSESSSDAESTWKSTKVNASMQFIYPIFYGLTKQDKTTMIDGHTKFNPIVDSDNNYDVVIDDNDNIINISDDKSPLILTNRQESTKLIDTVKKASSGLLSLKFGCWDETSYIIIAYPKKYNNIPNGVLTKLDQKDGKDGVSWSNLSTFYNANVTLNGFNYKGIQDESFDYIMYVLKGEPALWLCTHDTDCYFMIAQ